MAKEVMAVSNHWKHALKPEVDFYLLEVSHTLGGLGGLL